jgi:hypothetical protein
MRLQHIDAAFALCTKHKSTAEAAGLEAFQLKEIEHYLLRSMIMIIVSHYEELVQRLFVKRAEQCGDTEVHSLVSALTDRRFRSPDLGKISDILKLLSPSCRDSFQTQVDKKQPQAKAAWESLITARHAIVHKENNGAVALTWSDLEVAYQESQRVLQALANALGLTKKDLSQI